MIVTIITNPAKRPYKVPTNPIAYEKPPDIIDVAAEDILKAMPLFFLYFSTIIAWRVGYVVA